MLNSSTLAMLQVVQKFKINIHKKKNISEKTKRANFQNESSVLAHKKTMRNCLNWWCEKIPPNA